MEINVLHGSPDVFELKRRSERRVYSPEVLGSCSSYQPSAL